MKALALVLLAAMPVSAAPKTVCINVHNEIEPGQWGPVYKDCLAVPHRTADRSFWLIVATEQVGAIADAEVTHWSLEHNGREGNPVIGSHPSRAKLYGIMEASAGVLTYYTWRFKRQDDAIAADPRPAPYKLAPHRFTWWKPLVISAAVHGFAVGITFATR